LTDSGTLLAQIEPLALLNGVDSELLKPPAHALPISLHPGGLAPKIVNLGEWRQHLLDRSRRQFRICCDPALDTLLKELSGYPFSSSERQNSFHDTFANEVAIPLRLKTPEGVLLPQHRYGIRYSSRDFTVRVGARGLLSGRSRDRTNSRGSQVTATDHRLLSCRRISLRRSRSCFY
jgi:hypothetical protein